MKIHELDLHKNPRAFNINEIDYRSYFIPFESEEKLGQKREDSLYYTSLCGDWFFKYAASAYEMNDFVSDNRNLIDFKKITVPEVWQTHGYDYAQYQTSPYPFVFNPPAPPAKTLAPLM